LLRKLLKKINKNMKRILSSQAKEKIGEKIKVNGWIDSIRSHGKIVFADLRDRKGLLQIVFTPKEKELLEKSSQLKPEYVVEIKGTVQKRPDNMVNSDLESGTVELKAEELKILSEAKTPPFPLDTDGYKIDEEKRLKYRYLDLRRKRLRRNLTKRQKVTKIVRDFLVDKDFTEIETPILTKSTPEGARDFVVPSRLQPGKFYALPQSPQQYKQLLMVAGMEKYFQFAKCFRDEDPRADRAYGEFTQVDIELSFSNQKEILEMIEELFIKIVKEVFPNKKIKETPFPRISYKEAMEKWGTDKPDLRENKDDPNELAFCFIVDWPLFEKTEERDISPMHHPFTAPKEDYIKYLDEDPMKVLSWQHDFVLNGYEIGGGSIRITDPKIQEKIFEVLGHNKEEIHEKFGHLLEAFEYGVPPHGGIAPGLDRFLMALLGEKNIREVMAFPASSGGKISVMDAPSKISKDQLKELSIDIKKKEK
jgi:aspartyl-tRNA synthetase